MAADTFGGVNKDRHCVLCGCELTGALELDTGVCAICGGDV